MQSLLFLARLISNDEMKNPTNMLENKWRCRNATLEIIIINIHQDSTGANPLFQNALEPPLQLPLSCSITEKKCEETLQALWAANCDNHKRKVFEFKMTSWLQGEGWEMDTSSLECFLILLGEEICGFVLCVFRIQFEHFIEPSKSFYDDKKRWQNILWVHWACIFS